MTVRFNIHCKINDIMAYIILFPQISQIKSTDYTDNLYGLKEDLSEQFEKAIADQGCRGSGRRQDGFLLR